ncbi:MAG: TRL domain-containing protein [Spirochaetota bacterium]
MRILLFVICFSLQNCITTLAPGVLFNSTAEHVNSTGHTSYLGPGRLLETVENCRYSSILVQPFYYGNSSNLETILRGSKIKRIGVIDYSSFSIFGPLFYKSCIIIRGDRK